MHLAAERLTLVEPLFNLRELCKHLLLVEDHLLHASKRCPDCIQKHLLTVEALADEAVTLDPARLYAEGCELTAEIVRIWIEQLCDGDNPIEVAQEIRGVRKRLTPLVFDPRGEAIIDRVASAHMQRVAHGV